MEPSCWPACVISCQRQSQRWRPMRFFADGMPLVGQSPCSVRSRSPSCLPMYYHWLIQLFVRRKPCWPDKIQKSCALSGQSAIHRMNSAERLWTLRISQKAFSHMSNLCRWNSYRAEILKGKGTGFSWEWSFQTFRIGFDVKAFRKSEPTSARGGRNKNSPQLVPWLKCQPIINTGISVYPDVRPQGTWIRATLVTEIFVHLGSEKEITLNFTAKWA